MHLTLYFVPRSHPVEAVRRMLDFKSLQYDEVELVPGIHSVRLRLMGFPATTVPAMTIDGEKIQGSTRISRRLEQLVPDPPLFSRDPAARRAIEAAELWADQELQSINRNALRWILPRRGGMRVRFAPKALQPYPHLAAAAAWPQAALLAWLPRATAANVRRDLATLPAKLDHVDALIAEGTIGNEVPNAADFQIGSIVWAIRSFEDLRPLLANRPCAHLGELMGNERPRVPAFLPADWLP
ncbi:glutathione S-transferase family protein [Conexibacter sp. DBS9H8]|uniref:glutathione S-transferase family protein n=1 Tax=Conexibacter sp. DBS9H8 TaxID=2937801 RepID=UPI00200EA4AB|nr:glutathione S-transferase N-terminal domain-containing protein [Conexibacter sp. DBS9H8]